MKRYVKDPKITHFTPSYTKGVVVDFNKYVPDGLSGYIATKEKVQKGFGVNPQDVLSKLINHPVMAPFTHVSQLGPVAAFFPAGKTRNDHINAMMKMYETVLEKRLQFMPEMNCAIIILALVHDIGHAPTSHLLEFLFPKKHHEYGLEKLRSLKDAINAYGRDYLKREYTLMRYSALKFDPSVEMYPFVEKLYRSMDHDIGDPRLQNIHQIVSHPLLGIDKLEYTASDPSDTGLVYENYINSTYFDSLLKAIQWDPMRGIGLHLKRLEDAEIQAKRYVECYRRIYYNRQNQLVYRTYQRAVFETFCPKFDSNKKPQITKKVEDEIRSCTDGELMSYLSKKARGQKRLESIFTGLAFHQESSYKQMAAFVTDKSRPYTNKPSVENVEILSIHELNKICRYCYDPVRHVRLENKLAAMINLEPGELIMGLMESIESFERRINRMNCQIYCQEDKRKEGMLFEKIPDLKYDLTKEYISHFTISINILGDKKEKLNGKFGKMKALILEEIATE